MSFLRYPLSIVEALTYGPGYAGINYLIRDPKPLDPEFAWKALTVPEPNFGSWLHHKYPFGFMRRFILAARMKQDHLLGISAHYDVSNEFYKLFLDPDCMFYTCADFHSSDDTLQQAQHNKAAHILGLVDPQPGERILDLGCGWGAMMQVVHERTGDRENLVGYTLSQEQVDWIREQYQFNVEFKNFITCDYPDEHFDKIYSIGSWEHVRHADLQPTVNKLYRTLKPGGRMVKHFFTNFREHLTNDVIVAQTFFPGSYQPSHATQFQAFESAGFRVAGRTMHDYRPTLRAWFDNLVGNREQAIDLVGVRTYNKYLVFFAASHNFFQTQQATVIRYVLEKD